MEDMLISNCYLPIKTSKKKKNGCMIGTVMFTPVSDFLLNSRYISLTLSTILHLWSFVIF